MEVRKQRHHRLTVLRVQISGWFIRQEEQRFPRHCPRDRYPLLLSAGELPRVMVAAVAHSHLLQDSFDALAPLKERQLPEGERKLDVLVNGQVSDQVEALEDEADMLVAPLRPFAGRKREDFRTVEPIGSLVGYIEQTED